MKLDADQLEKWKKEFPVCQECGGNPDDLYFNSETKEVLAVICTGCREAIEATILSVGKLFDSTSWR